MAALVPVITQLTPSTWDASGIIDAIATHTNSGSSTHTDRDAYNSAEGVTISFTDAGEDQQINFRKTGANTIDVSIEPTGTITDPGNSTPTAPTGTSAQWSDEFEWDLAGGINSPGAGSKMWFWEVPDAMLILISDTLDTVFRQGCHGGRIYTPILSSTSVSEGQDGLGCLIGEATYANGGVGDWMSTSSNSFARWQTTTWGDNVGCVFTPSTSYAADTGTGVTYYPPAPNFININSLSDTGQSPIVGVFKYFKQLNASHTVKDVIPDASSNQGWLSVRETTSIHNSAWLWDKTVTP